MKKYNQKIIKKNLASIVVLVIALLILNTAAFADMYESPLGYTIDYDKTNIIVKNENNIDKYFYKQKPGLEVRKTSDKVSHNIRYKELEANYKNTDYLKNLLPEGYKDKNVKAVLNERDSGVQLEIKISNGEYYTPFYIIEYIYPGYEKGATYEIRFEYFFESIEGTMYPEFKKIITAITNFSETNKSTSKQTIGQDKPVESTPQQTVEMDKTFENQPSSKPVETPFLETTSSNLNLKSTKTNESNTIVFLVLGISVIVIISIILLIIKLLKR